MVEIKRLRKILMLITSVRVKIQLNLIRTFVGQFLKGNSMGPITTSQLLKRLKNKTTQRFLPSNLQDNG